VLANDLALAGYFEAAARQAKQAKTVANWILNDLLSALSAGGHTIAECPIPADALDELVNLVDVGVISTRQAKEVFAEMFASRKAASIIVEEKGLKQESDTGALEAYCRQAIEANPRAVAEFRAGKVASINFLKGQVMKLSQGKANPALVGDLLAKLLSLNP
jgi:aspartyl-tRNA(Asn)/glutamyl-tRNA(Gln) amidotransferase subunit B